MKFRGVLFALGSVCLPSVYAQAVLSFGAISGTVLDYTGSGIPDTTVIISNPALGVSREFETTDDGLFNSVALPPGPGYNVKFSRNGFKAMEYRNFELPTGHTLHFDVSMIEQPTPRPEEKESLAVHDITGELEISFSPLEVSGLPTEDRDPENLAPLGLYVVKNYQTGQLAFEGVQGTTAIETDGIWTTNSYFFDKPAVAVAVTQEAVEGVQVISGDAAAEFGHSRNGFVNAVTDRGTNGIHGEAYDYFNTHSLNAPDRFAGGFRPPGWQQQFGADAGGRAPHKFFWFANGEDLDRHSAGLNLAFNPVLTNAEGTAIAPQIPAAVCTATATQCANATAFLNSQLNRVVNSSLESLRGLAKVDWRPSDTHNISAEFGAIHQHSPNGIDLNTVSNNAGLLGHNGNYTDENRFARAGYTVILAADAVNDFRATYYRDRLSEYPDPALAPAGFNAAPDGSIVGIDIAGSQFGGNPLIPSALSEKRYQLIDSLNIASASHAIKLGVDFSFNEDWNRQIINSAGDYFYPTLTAFADDYTGNTTSKKDYSSLLQGFGQPIADLHSKALNVYLQDTWKPTSRLTAVVGVIWEKPFLPGPTYTSAVFYQTGSITSPNVDFSPRVGLAYRLNDRTVVRLGLSSFYQPFPGQLLETLFTGNGIYQLQTSFVPSESAAPLFPRILGTAGSVPEGTPDIVFEDSKFRIPLSAQGTASIERRVLGNMTVTLNYMYSRGLSLWTGYDTNLNAPTVSETYTIDNAAGTAVGSFETPIYKTKTNTDFAHVFQLGNDGTSNYQGASMLVRQPFAHGLAFHASYTWSHAVDDVNGPPAVAGIIPSSFFVGNFGQLRANANFDQPSRGVVEWTWQPVFSHGDSVFDRYVINGWRLSAAATIASGLKETPLVEVNGQQFTGQTLAYPTSLNGSGGWSIAPFLGVNTLSTGMEYNVDARLSREIPIIERVHAMLMLEGFNALNTQFNTSVNTLAYLATSGVLHALPGVGLGNSAAGYPWGDNARHVQIALRVVF